MEDAKRRLAVVSKHVIVASSVAARDAVGVDELAHYPEGVYFGTMPDYEHPIFAPEAGIASFANMPTVTMPVFFDVACENNADDYMLASEHPVPPPEAPGVAPSLPWADWKKWTGRQFHADVQKAAKAFMELGVEHFGTVSIFGFNTPEWCISAWAAMMCGAKFSGIYLTDTADEMQYKVLHSNTAVLVVEGRVEFEKVRFKLEEMPCLKAVVTWDMIPEADLVREDGSAVRALTFEDLLQLGENPKHDEELASRKAAQRPGHAIGLIYTSGTTGNPKAVMISQDNVICQQYSLLNGFGEKMDRAIDKGRALSYLPLSHIAGATGTVFTPVGAAFIRKKQLCVYFARPYDLKEMTLAARLAFVRPTMFLGVPRVYEKIMARMLAVGATITGVKKKISTWAKGKGLENTLNQNFGGSKQTPFLHGLADRLVLSKAREALGLDQAQIFFTGAAPMSKECLDYFGSLGMPILNAYGMSESTGIATVCLPDRNVFGTTGVSLPGMGLKVFREGPNGELVEAKRCQPGANPTEEEQGELCYRGRNIMMGYMANADFGPEHVAEIEAKNRGAIDSEGWLHSGDKGSMDINGFVRITGRYKEIIIGAGGENIAPVPVEEGIKAMCPALSNVMMVGDNRPYNVALVTLLADGANGELPGTDQLTGAALAVNPSVTTVSGAINDKRWRDYIQAGITATNSNPNICRSNPWKVQKFVILPRDFAVSTGELTSTLKLKRSVASDMWADAIDSMY